MDSYIGKPARVFTISLDATTALALQEMKDLFNASDDVVIALSLRSTWAIAKKKYDDKMLALMPSPSKGVN